MSMYGKVAKKVPNFYALLDGEVCIQNLPIKFFNFKHHYLLNSMEFGSEIFSIRFFNQINFKILQLLP